VHSFGPCLESLFVQTSMSSVELKTTRHFYHVGGGGKV
jgi:hypothetical protein